MTKLSVLMQLPSVANMRLHWAAKAKLFKAQRRAVWASLMSVDGREELWGLGTGRCLRVTLTRVSPRKLDDDNLQAAFKAVRDEVARWLGIDDGDPRVDWWYAQEKGISHVRIEIELNTDSPTDGGDRGADMRRKPLDAAAARNPLAPTAVQFSSEKDT